MRKRLFSILIVVVLLLNYSSAFIVNAAKPIVVVYAKGSIEPDKQLKAMMTDLTWITWKPVLDELTSANLEGASMLIMVKIDSSSEYTANEINVVKNWFAIGGKTLWVTSDSDFPPNDMKRQASANAVLAAVQSKLRIESAAVEDPASSADAPYRVLAVSEACDTPVKFLVDGVTRALFHGPGPVVGYVNNKYVALENTTVENVYKIMTSTVNGELKDNDPTVAPEVHILGNVGRLTVMAMEIVPAKKNIIIATGEAPIAQYEGLYKPEISNNVRYGVKYPTDGERLFNNLLAFTLVMKDTWFTDQANIASKNTQISTLNGQITTLNSDKSSLQTQLTAANSSISTWQMAAVGLLIVGVIVGYLVGPMLKKK
ncbi:hypothetical protein FJY84_00185 [Candidatus Bathyarchaeota archaeon]|nr:hypothetical protein [Candidatus Bathyarchaeota archaeon]